MNIDSQRLRLYEAEDLMISTHYGRAILLERIEDVQEVVDGILRSEWWQERSMYTGIRVIDGPEYAGAEARLATKKLVMPPVFRTPLLIIHEMAHFLTDVNCDAHGPEFAYNYTSMVIQFLGVEAANSLMNWFSVMDVKYTCESVCPCGKATVFRETRPNECGACAGRRHQVRL